jgi:hypothetical protein
VVRTRAYEDQLVQIGMLGPCEVRTDDGVRADLPGVRMRAGHPQLSYIDTVAPFDETGHRRTNKLTAIDQVRIRVRVGSRNTRTLGCCQPLWTVPKASRATVRNMAIGSRAFAVPARLPLAHSVAKPCASDQAAT